MQDVYSYHHVTSMYIFITIFAAYTHRFFYLHEQLFAINHLYGAASSASLCRQRALEHVFDIIFVKS